MTTWPDGTTATIAAGDAIRIGIAEATPSRVFNVEAEEYGAVADDFYVDGAAVSGDATFTSATANFTAGDVGKTIVILRAGASSAQDHHSTIASINSSTSVELTHTAGRTNATCRFYISRGGAQDAAIQSAIDDAAAAGGGYVLCPGVGYLLGATLVLKHRVYIGGAGRFATMLHLAGSVNDAVITNDTTLNDTAKGWGVENIRLDGNRARQADVTTTLGAGYTAGQTTLTVASTAGLTQGGGELLIGTNRFNYQTVASGTSLTSVGGGARGTSDANASNGATVTQHKANGIYIGNRPFNSGGTIEETFDPHGVIRNVYIKNVRGDGIQIWGQSEVRVENVWCVYADHAAFVPSFDTWLSNCTADTAGRMGFFLSWSSIRMSLCKAFFCGGNSATEGWGFLLEGSTAGNEGTKSLAACEAQDNKADGFYLRNTDRVIGQLVASSNGTSTPGSFVGLRMDGARNCIIDMVATERVAASSNAQRNAVSLAETSRTLLNNRIRVTHAAASGSAVGDAILSGSVLTGSVVEVNGSGGGVRVLTGQSGTVTAPDPYIALNNEYALSGSVTGVPAPVNGHRGCRLTITLVPGSGSLTATGWNSVYKFAGATAPTMTTTANRRDSITFESNGTNWYEVARSLDVAA